MPGTVPSTLCALIYSSLNNTTSGHHFKLHFTDENLEVQSVYVTCPGQEVNSAVWWGDLAKPFFCLFVLFFGLIHPQVRHDPGRGRAGGTPGVGAEQARGIWQEKPQVQRKWWNPRIPLSSPGFGPCTPAPSPRVSPSALRAASVPLYLCPSVYSSPTQPALSFPPTSQARNSDPKVQERGWWRPRGVQKALFPLPLLRGAAGAPAVTPPRRADGASEDPGGQISLSFDRSFPIRSGFPPPLPTALPCPRGSQGSPAGSGFAWLRPAPPARASPLLLSGFRSSLDFGRSFAERGMGGQAQVLPRESSPLFQSPARGALGSLRRQFFAPSLHSALPSLALEANWYRNRSLSLF